jgi:tetratricopeptide (TPR) repeat protein
MFAVRRLTALGTILSLAALIAVSHVWGEPQGDADRHKKDLTGSTPPVPAPDGKIDLAGPARPSRFAERPLVLYQTQKGETLFAYSVKPRLAPVPALPTDYIVVVDTSASKARGPLDTARALVGALRKAADKDDRIALWTINTSARDLSDGLKKVADLDQPLQTLAKEVPLGAVNLKEGLEKITTSLPGGVDRRRAIVYLGDGQGIAGPLDANDRAGLCDRMIKNQVGFFSVPVGKNFDPANLHGLATGTGGKVVRFSEDDNPLDRDGNLIKWTSELKSAIAAPVLYPANYTPSDGVAEAFPTKLPPLRGDVPTLLVGRLDKADHVGLVINGKVGENEIKVELNEKITEPEIENYFLVGMFNQWRTEKDRPAMIPADRALGFAYERNRLACADLLAKASLALERKNLDGAHRLYTQVLDIDPNAEDAKDGVKLVDDLRDGKVKLDDLVDALRNKKKPIIRIKGNQIVRLEEGEEAQGGKAPPPAPDKPPELAPPVPPGDPLAELRARQAVADHQMQQIVDEAIRQARRLVESDPDGAREFLKRTIEGLRANPDVSARARASLGERMERALQNVDLRGTAVRRMQSEDLSARAAAANRRDVLAQQKLVQDQIREQMRVFHNLMDQARLEEAYRQAHAIRVALINQGLPVPNAVTAAYHVGLAGFHLREERELVRLREERWLATMLQVEKSHVPFPDEPPVEFPPAASWLELTKRRKEKYETTSFNGEVPTAAYNIIKALAKPVNYGGLEDPKADLAAALDQLSKSYGIVFDINEKAFTFEAIKDVAKSEITNPNPIPAMRATLATVLRKILSRVQVPSGATWVIRKDTIEITTGTFAAAEKAIRVYPVADLVVPIPQSINVQNVVNQATIFGIGLLGSPSVTFAGGIGGVGGLAGVAGIGGIGGLGLAGLGGIGGIGGIGGLGGLGGLGALGAGGLGLAGLGGGIGGLGAAGLAGIGGGFNMLGVQGGFMGNFQGQNNLGVGGGVVGLGGGQLGQFGNLGGQFGLQGGTQHQILITLIRQVVGKPKDWAIQFNPITGQPLNPLDENDPAAGLAQENNQIGFYPPSLALVVKASSTIHNKASNIIVPNAAPGPGGMGALELDRHGDALANAGGGKGSEVKVGAAGGERPDDKDPRKKGFDKNTDPHLLWQWALAKGVDDPGLIIATADFLAMNNRWDHTVAFLKADLKQGIVVEPWVYKSLAVAMRTTGASPEEIERVEVSAADLSPKDARGYIDAARALAADKRYAMALAFCRQAAILEPNLPYAYAEAVNYAELARDAKTMEWAAGKLLSQDWPLSNKELHARADQKLQSLARLLAADDRKDQAERLLALRKDADRRDLIVKLAWQGDAALDLKVTEPTGSNAGPLNRQTVAGGTFLADSSDSPNSGTYVAAEAFSGNYAVTVERAWGRPLGDKAQLRIIRHHGTPEETEELVTIDMKGSRIGNPVTVKFENGRRHETAYVPPLAAYEKPEPVAVRHSDQVQQKLRALADPMISGVEASGLTGEVAAQGRPVLRDAPRTTRDVMDDPATLRQTRLAPFIGIPTTVDVTAQAVISGDRRTVRLSLNPVLTNILPGIPKPAVPNPFIPGSLSVVLPGP